MSDLPTKNDYEKALATQSACNLSGVAQSLAEVMPRIWNEAREKGEGTEYVNQHPIVRLYAEQIMHLSLGCDYFKATKACEEKVEEFDKEAQATRLSPKRIKKIRKGLGMTQIEFASLMGVSFATVNRWEKGHHPPLPDRAKKILIYE